MHNAYVKSSLKNVKLIIECVYRGLKYLWPKNLEFSFCNTYFFIRLGATSSRVQGIALLSVKKQTFSKACNKVLYYLKLPTLKNQESLFVQVNLCQNMLCTKIVLNTRNNFCTQHVLPRFELGIFMY